MEFEKELESTLKEIFEDDDVEIQLEKANRNKIGGYIASKHFEGMSHADRQKKLWDHLERNLKAEKLERIVAILTMTPEELKDAESPIRVKP